MLRVIALLIVVLLSQLAVAQNLNTENDKLERLEQTLENHQSYLEDIHFDLEVFTGRISETEQELTEARQSLQLSTRTLTKAEAAASRDASPANERVLRQAKGRHKIKSYSVKSRNNRLDMLNGKVNQLKTDLTEAEEKERSIKQRIERQRLRIADIKTRPREPARPTPAVVAKAPAPAPKAVRPAIKMPLLDEHDLEALEYVRREMKRLNLLLDKGKEVRPRYNHLYLKGNRLSPSQFKHLGMNQYRVDVIVKSGKNSFKVGNKKFIRTIPLSDDGVSYTFIYDAQNISRTRLAVMKTSLLEHI